MRRVPCVPRRFFLCYTYFNKLDAELVKAILLKDTAAKDE